MLLVFAGGHRMGSTYQHLIGLHALKQLGIKFGRTDNPALATFHLQKIRESFRATDAHPKQYYIAKCHAGFPAQVEAVMTAKHSRIYLVWRRQRDCLVSDFHYAQRKAGHAYVSFDDYYWRRGRKILLRNCLQKVVWDEIDDPRVRAWPYLDLVEDFDRAAGEMLAFAGLEGADIGKLADSVSIGSLRKTYKDPGGTFFREGGRQDLRALGPSPQALASIEEVEGEYDWRKLGRAFEREDWLRIAAFGRESRDAGLRKTFHWWLTKTGRIQRWRTTVLPKLYKLSPWRLIGARRAPRG